MALHTRAPLFAVGTRIDTTQLTRLSKLVSGVTGMAVQANKAVVGANAFAHESGIHQDGLLKHQATYEIMKPETVGASHTALVLGKHSGRAALAVRLTALGYTLDNAAIDRVFARFKIVADRRKHITDADLEALIQDGLPEIGEAYALDALHVGCGTMGMPTATVRLRGKDGEVRVQASVGTGPVDAAYKAVDAIVDAHASLLEYSVRSVTEGIDALGHVTVRVRDQRGRVFHGAGADPDIIVASVQAYLRALNRITATRQSQGDRDAAHAV